MNCFRQRGPAIHAEPCFLWIIRLAIRAFHQIKTSSQNIKISQEYLSYSSILDFDQLLPLENKTSSVLPRARILWQQVMTLEFLSFTLQNFLWACMCRKGILTLFLALSNDRSGGRLGVGEEKIAVTK